MFSYTVDFDNNDIEKMSTEQLNALIILASNELTSRAIKGANKDAKRERDV